MRSAGTSAGTGLGLAASAPGLELDEEALSFGAALGVMHEMRSEGHISHLSKKLPL